MDHATGALGSLLGKLVQLLADEYTRLMGLRKDVEFLERELTSMHAALRKVAEVPRDQIDDQVRLWANEVRELSYNMEDVVDRFLVRVQGPDNPVKSSNKLKKLMKKMAELFTEGKTRHQIADAIKDIKDQVKDVAARRDRYKIDDIVVNPTATATVDPRLLALYKDQKEIVGIQEASVDLINRLAVGNGDDDASMQHLKVLSILGFGGLGKTTLAKAVYDGMKEQFECIAFVSVGRNPDWKKLVKNILCELDKHKYMSFNEAMFSDNQLINELRGLLQNKSLCCLHRSPACTRPSFHDESAEAVDLLLLGGRHHFLVHRRRLPQSLRELLSASRPNPLLTSKRVRAELRRLGKWHAQDIDAAQLLATAASPHLLL